MCKVFFVVSLDRHPDIFSELTHLFFLKLSMVLGAIFSYMWQSRTFLEKRWCQKGSKNKVFWKIKSLAFSGNSVKRKFLWSFNILWKLSLKLSVENLFWFSSYGQNWLLANEISVFFNCQYFMNRSISGLDFWNVDRDEW